MKIYCKYDELVPVSSLNLNPKNRNAHPEAQIKRLAQVLAYQGWRYPVKVSKVSGFVTSGHGRIEAARLNGWDTVPVNFQDYESSDQEYADTISDNSIASWAELDLKGINVDLPELGPDFDLECLGLEMFTLDRSEKPQSNEKFNLTVTLSAGPELERTKEFLNNACISFTVRRFKQPKKK